MVMIKTDASDVMSPVGGARVPETASASPPIGQGYATKALAPFPAVDRYPIVIGQSLSLQYVASVFRLCLTGYRSQYVDLLDELLEKDGHAYSVVAKRVLAVARGKMDILEVDLGPKASKREKKLAEAVAETVRRQVLAIPNLEQHLAWLLWGLYYSLSGTEIHWRRGDGRSEDDWVADRLSGVHSRRFAYTDAATWDLYIWDLGNVLSYFGQAPTNGVRGLRVADHPGKFIIHSAQLRGNYPTREGLGRHLAIWIVLKLIASRGASKYLEQFARDLADISYKTTQDKPREATEDDIEDAKAAAKSVSNGTLGSWVHADAVTLKFNGPDSSTGAKTTYQDWIRICDEEESKIALGNTLTTSVGQSGGNRALGDTQKKSELTLYEYDANNLAATLKRDLFYWIVFLNYDQKTADRYTPHAHIRVEDEPNPSEIIERAYKGALAGMPIDADKIAEESGLPLVDPKDKNARRLVPLKPIELPAVRDLTDGPSAIPRPTEENGSGNTDASKPGGALNGAPELDEEDPEPDDETTPAAN